MVSFTLTSDIVAGVVIGLMMDDEALIVFDLSDCDRSNKYASSSISSSGVTSLHLLSLIVCHSCPNGRTVDTSDTMVLVV